MTQYVIYAGNVCLRYTLDRTQEKAWQLLDEALLDRRALVDPREDRVCCTISDEHAAQIRTGASGGEKA